MVVMQTGVHWFGLEHTAHVRLVIMVNYGEYSSNPPTRTAINLQQYSMRLVDPGRSVIGKGLIISSRSRITHMSA